MGLNRGPDSEAKPGTKPTTYLASNHKFKVDLTSNLTNDRSISISFLHRTQWTDQFHQKHNKSVILITSQIKAINHKKHKYESKNADLDEINYKEVIKRFDYIPVDIRFAEI